LTKVWDGLTFARGVVVATVSLDELNRTGSCRPFSSDIHPISPLSQRISLGCLVTFKASTVSSLFQQDLKKKRDGLQSNGTVHATSAAIASSAPLGRAALAFVMLSMASCGSEKILSRLQLFPSMKI
jgi:hypothetical protein